MKRADLAAFDEEDEGREAHTQIGVMLLSWVGLGATLLAVLVFNILFLITAGHVLEQTGEASEISGTFAGYILAVIVSLPTLAVFVGICMFYLRVGLRYTGREELIRPWYGWQQIVGIATIVSILLGVVVP